MCPNKILAIGIKGKCVGVPVEHDRVYYPAIVVFKNISLAYHWVCIESIWYWLFSLQYSFQANVGHSRAC